MGFVGIHSGVFVGIHSGGFVRIHSGSDFNPRLLAGRHRTVNTCDEKLDAKDPSDKREQSKNCDEIDEIKAQTR